MKWNVVFATIDFKAQKGGSFVAFRDGMTPSPLVWEYSGEDLKVRQVHKGTESP